IVEIPKGVIDRRGRHQDELLRRIAFQQLSERLASKRIGVPKCLRLIDHNQLVVLQTLFQVRIVPSKLLVVSEFFIRNAFQVELMAATEACPSSVAKSC